MSSKYHSRNSFSISRDENSFDKDYNQPDWAKDIDAKLKEAVKSRKEDNSLFNQINNILGNKSKYSSVEEAVLDMQKRTGLFDLINKKAQSNQLIKQPDIFTKIPDLKTFIDNYIEDRPGTSIEAVIHNLLKIKSIKDKLPENDDVPLDIKKYINDKIGECNKNNNFLNETNNGQIGKLDMSNADDAQTMVDNNPFSGCDPKGRT